MEQLYSQIFSGEKYTKLSYLKRPARGFPILFAFGNFNHKTILKIA